MLPSRHLLAAVTVVVVLAATPALAEWVVMRVSQPARYAVDGRSWQPIEAGMEMPNHAWIHTGRSGRVLLRRDGDLIQFKPNTVAALSRRAGSDVTTILQKFGSLLVVVEPRPHRSMSIETPYLALIVKGTRFEVDVDRTSVELRVHAGVVEATHPTLGRRAEVYAGQVALAQGNRRFAVRGGAPEPRIIPVPPREPRVSPATPARAPVEMSAPHSSSDDDDEPEPFIDRRERDGRQRLIEAIRASQRDERREKQEARDRSENAGDGQNDPAAPDAVPDAGDAPSEDPGTGDAGGDTGAGPDAGFPPDVDDEPGAGTPDNVEDESDAGASDDVDGEPDSPGLDDARAPFPHAARATRRA